MAPCGRGHTEEGAADFPRGVPSYTSCTKPFRSRAGSVPACARAPGAPRQAARRHRHGGYALHTRAGGRAVHGRPRPAP
ncbi:hypothetical protein SFR_2667 [Streptomyces sp. FR-008]|nr:hypothetical protein SFR_2667 [Streptomyces sp. FR-008]